MRGCPIADLRAVLSAGPVDSQRIAQVFDRPRRTARRWLRELVALKLAVKWEWWTKQGRRAVWTPHVRGATSAARMANLRSSSRAWKQHCIGLERLMLEGGVLDDLVQTRSEVRKLYGS